MRKYPCFIRKHSWQVYNCAVLPQLQAGSLCYYITGWKHELQWQPGLPDAERAFQNQQRTLASERPGFLVVDCKQFEKKHPSISGMKNNAVLSITKMFQPNLPNSIHEFFTKSFETFFT